MPISSERFFNCAWYFNYIERTSLAVSLRNFCNKIRTNKNYDQSFNILNLILSLTQADENDIGLTDILEEAKKKNKIDYNICWKIRSFILKAIMYIIWYKKMNSYNSLISCVSISLLSTMLRHCSDSIILVTRFSLWRKP